MLSIVVRSSTSKYCHKIGSMYLLVNAPNHHSELEAELHRLSATFQMASKTPRLDHSTVFDSKDAGDVPSLKSSIAHNASEKWSFWTAFWTVFSRARMANLSGESYNHQTCHKLAKKAREYDTWRYRERHLVESLFNKIEHFRRIFSRLLLSGFSTFCRYFDLVTLK